MNWLLSDAITIYWMELGLGCNIIAYTLSSATCISSNLRLYYSAVNHLHDHSSISWYTNNGRHKNDHMIYKATLKRMRLILVINMQALLLGIPLQTQTDDNY